MSIADFIILFQDQGEKMTKSEMRGISPQVVVSNPQRAGWLELQTDSSALNVLIEFATRIPTLIAITAGVHTSIGLEIRQVKEDGFDDS